MTLEERARQRKIRALERRLKTTLDRIVKMLTEPTQEVQSND